MNGFEIIRSKVACLNRCILTLIVLSSAILLTGAAAFYAGRATAPSPRPPVIITIPAAAPTAAPAPVSNQVWVNLNTGVYHLKGERWYGSTTKGKFMSEADAIHAGYRPTQNGQ